MIPFLKPKIWYAFQGLPIERIGSEDRLPWSKCSVLTNNIMYILQFPFLTETFVKTIDKKTADKNQGVTFKEYIEIFNSYLKSERTKSEEIEDRSERNLFLNNLEKVAANYSPVRPRGNTMDSPSMDKTSDKKSEKVDMNPLIKTFDDYTWTLYRTKKLCHLSIQPTLNDAYQKMWLIFITYSIKEESSNSTKIPVFMDLLEAKYWLAKIQELLGSRRIVQDVDVKEKVTEINFLEFYDMNKEFFKSTNINERIINTTLSTLAEEALEGVTMKGPLKVDRYLRYCVIKSYTIFIYNNKTEPINFRISYEITPETEILAGTNKILLRSSRAMVNPITFESNDIQQLNKWRTAFTDAIFYAKAHILNPAMYDAQIRENARADKRRCIKLKRLSMELKIEEERNVRNRLTETMEKKLNKAAEELRIYQHRIEEEQLMREELVKESESIRKETDERINKVLTYQQYQNEEQVKRLEAIENEKRFLNEKLQLTMEEKSLEEQKRTFLEEKHDEAQKMLLEAEEKITFLKTLGENLEKALEEEKLAKEEEEAVRNATMALLEEEQSAKAKLEELLEQQNNTLSSEIQKSQEFAEALANEKLRIMKIAEEKEKLSKQLEDSQQKMQKTGNRVKNLDSKVTKIAETVFGKNDNQIPVSHRGQGFIAEIMVESRVKVCRKNQRINEPICLPHNNNEIETEFE